MDPQLTRPKNGNKYYNTPEYLGINPGRPNPKRVEKGLTALPNCVSYAIGRFNEIGAYGKIKYLGPYYPYAMIGVAKKQGLQISEEPVLGGMMVWYGGKTGEGHVDIVEEIKYDFNGKIKNITTSDSEYYGSAFKTFRRTIGRDHNWRVGCYWMDSSYIFKGCIVNPAVEDDMLTYEDFCKYMQRYEAELKAKPASSNYAKEAIGYMKEKGYMTGDKNGNTMPQSPLKREDYAILTYNILKDKDAL